LTAEVAEVAELVEAVEAIEAVKESTTSSFVIYGKYEEIKCRF
jgi:hypothetical protein